MHGWTYGLVALFLLGLVSSAPAQEANEVTREKGEKGVLWTVTFPEDISALATSPDGTELFVGTEAPRIRVLNFEGEELRTLSLKGRYSPVAIAPSPDGKSLAVARKDGLHLLNATSGTSIWKADGHPGGEYGNKGADACVFTPDGKEILTVNDDPIESAIRFWSTEDGSLLRKAETGLYTASVLAVSPDGKRILVGGTAGGKDKTFGDRTARVGAKPTIVGLDRTSGKRLWQAETDAFGDPKLGFEPGSGLAAWGNESEVALASPGDGTIQRKLPIWVRVDAFAFTPDGERVVGAVSSTTNAYETVYIQKTGLDPGDPRALDAKFEVGRLVTNGNGTRAAASENEENRIRIYRLGK